MKSTQPNFQLIQDSTNQILQFLKQAQNNEKIPQTCKLQDDLYIRSQKIGRKRRKSSALWKIMKQKGKFREKFHWNTIRKLSRQIFLNVQNLSDKENFLKANELQFFFAPEQVLDHTNEMEHIKNDPVEKNSKDTKISKLCQIILKQFKAKPTDQHNTGQQFLNLHYTTKILKKILKNSIFPPQFCSKFIFLCRQPHKISKKSKSKNKDQWIKTEKMYEFNHKIQLKLSTSLSIIDVHPYYSFLCKNIFHSNHLTPQISTPNIQQNQNAYIMSLKLKYPLKSQQNLDNISDNNHSIEMSQVMSEELPMIKLQQYKQLDKWIQKQKYQLFERNIEIEEHINTKDDEKL